MNYNIENFDFIETLINSYEKDVLKVDKFYALHESQGQNFFYHYTDSPFFHSKEKALKSVLYDNWKIMFNHSNINSLLSARQKEKFEVSLKNPPEFTYENIKHTLQGWGNSLNDMFIDKVDELFYNMSYDHVTNKPYGFSKKIIYQNFIDISWLNFSSTPRVTSRCVDLCHSLRTCIQQIYKLPISSVGDTDNILHALTFNDKLSIDGGAFIIKVFKNGNAHIEIHPDVAIKLNSVLANKYPNVIPSKNRTKQREIKEYNFIYRHVTCKKEIIDFLKKGKIFHSLVSDELKSIFNFIGLTKIDDYFINDGFENILQHIILNGLVDYKSNQYYPTPDCIVDYIKNNLIIDGTVLEPSAGTGNLARLYSNCDVCEKEPLNQLILLKKGFNIVCDDFLKYNKKYDTIIMNPPYSNQQWKTHVEHALRCLNENGVIIAILPNIATINAYTNFKVSHIKQFDDVFENTAITTHLVTITK